MGINNNINDLELHDLIGDSNFDQFIDLIRGENDDPLVSFGCDDLINGSNNFVHNNIDRHFLGGTDHPLNDDNNHVFGFNASPLVSSEPNSLSFIDILEIMPEYFEGKIMNNVDMVGNGDDDDDDEENDGNDSSGTTTTTTPTPKPNPNPNASSKRPKVDRSRTLISERRRRSRMKEKLYALRSLVPNITKMDKASIVGDAVLYVQDLQTKSKKLKAEIASLEASLAEVERDQGSTIIENSKKIKDDKANDSHPIPKMKIITQMDMFQVEERGFYVKVVCNKGERAGISLYKALESLTNFNIQSSNLATVSDTFVLTFTLNVLKECSDQREPINLPNLKLWVTGAFINQGFELKTAF
ncbi:transcription factor FER-LIKE IRON DEFICIENCY-INDUCED TRANSCRIPTION FACTOR-like [Humulus lupulus]|uniref:transcription factor FER-LIKE IRON DEFICIENCY-INDUCED TRANSCRIPTION FACTOR-like n=1 Tax=Humulus lupulus TaxID=3486 RepID=UPI002B405554|nr:transcription factor FER-LIKE IRON DEFICIENCY-INDUCED TRANSCRIPTION FACTOR-like [Humulus lupulus]